MIYEYYCRKCQHKEEIIKSAKDSSTKEWCEDCKEVMVKLFSRSVQVKTTAFQSGYYHAFGKEFTTKDHLREEIKKAKYERGQDIIECGNEKPKLKPKRKEYSI